MHERSTIFIADVPSIISALWIWSQVELSRSICTWTALFFFLLSMMNACSRWKKRKAVCTVCEASWGCTMQFLSLLWIKRNKKDPHYSHPSFFFWEQKHNGPLFPKTYLLQSYSDEQCLHSKLPASRWDELLLIFIFIFFTFSFILQITAQFTHSVITLFFLSINQAKTKHPCQSKCLRRHLPEADETRNTGGALRPTGSTCDILNLCPAISSPPWSGVEKKKKIFTALLS